MKTGIYANFLNRLYSKSNGNLRVKKFIEGVFEDLVKFLDDDNKSKNLLLIIL